MSTYRSHATAERDATGSAVYGLDAELARKQRDKLDTGAISQVCDWIHTVTGHSVSPSNFQKDLMSGVVLCDLINKIQPGSVKKVNKMSMPFMQMENISAYLNACRAIKVPEPDMFMTVDLFEGKNIPQVVQNVQSLGRVAQSITTFAGPHFGPKIASKNVRTFTEEQLREAAAEVPIMTASASKGASQAGMAKESVAHNVVKVSSVGDTTTPTKFSMGSSGGASQAGMGKESVKHEIVKIRTSSTPSITTTATTTPSSPSSVKSVDAAVKSLSLSGSASPKLGVNSIVRVPDEGWFYMLPTKQQKGPIQLKDLKVLYSQGFVNADSFVLHETLDTWTKVSDVTGLKSALL